MAEPLPIDRLQRIKTRLAEIVGDDHALDDDQTRDVCSRDETRNYRFLPDIVARPGTAGEIEEIVHLAHLERVPLTPRGAGTGLSGGCLPVEGGIVLDCTRMRHILEVDRDTMMAVVEPGVVTAEVNQACEEFGLFYPPDPSSMDSCTIAGNVAENAGGPRAVKYGVTNAYLTGMGVCWPEGGQMRFGGKLLKNVTGYNWLAMMAGSEGTLGVFTELTLRLEHLCPYKEILLADFTDAESGSGVVNRILNQGIDVSALELMDHEAMGYAYRFLERPVPPDLAGARLLIEIESHRLADFEERRTRIGELCMQGGADDLFVADSSAKQEEAWAIRRNIGKAVKSHSAYEEEDVVVPRSRLGIYFREAKAILHNHGLNSALYGHAGDGNVHTNILQGDFDESEWDDRLAAAVPEIFDLVKRLGGTLTGEHGVGLLQKPRIGRFVSEAEIAAGKSLKSIIDPHGILNPGKIFP